MDAVERAPTFVDASTLPGHVTGAFISGHDPGFLGFRPFGIDILPCCGGTAITGQVARQIILSGQPASTGIAGWHQKMLVLTAKLDWAAPKRRILNAYLNRIYVGKERHGIHAAAQLYFDKSPLKLDVAQAAFIAVMVRAPRRFCRSASHKQGLSRRNRIIDSMVADGVLTVSSGKTAQAAPLVAKGCFGDDAAALSR